jgi:hypothetical protein
MNIQNNYKDEVLSQASDVMDKTDRVVQDAYLSVYNVTGAVYASVYGYFLGTTRPIRLLRSFTTDVALIYMRVDGI